MLRRCQLIAAALSALTACPLLLGAQNQGGQLYRDPAGRFSVAIPNGWQVTSQNGGAILTRGNTMAMVTPFQGASSGREVVGMLANQYGSQWRNFASVNRGDFQLAGQPASYATFTGISPKGVASLLRLSGFASGGQGFAFVMSAPNNEFNQASNDLQAIEGSFALGGGGNNGGGFQPSPGAGGNYPPANGSQAVLGVQTRDIEQADLQQLGLREMRGALIAALQPGGPAERAGLRQGDVVLSADRNQIFRASDLRQLVASHQPGDQLTLGVVRQGQSGTVQVVLGGGDSGQQPNGNPGAPINPGNPGNPGGFGGASGSPTQPSADSTASAPEKGPLGQILSGESPVSLMLVLGVVVLGLYLTFRKKS